MKTILLVVLVLGLAGCGSNLDGSANFTNGALHGNVNATVNTPLGVWTPAVSFDEAAYSPDRTDADARP